MRVLVTGGTGLVGSAIKNIAPDWDYIGSKDCNLLDRSAFKKLLIKRTNKYGHYDWVIHLAANVGGLFKNIEQKVTMFEENLEMNLNVIKCCKEAGIKRMICCLSTCIFPDGLDSNEPMTEKDIHNGEPHNSNFGYAYAKRMIEVHCRLINETYTDYRYQCIIPCNVYGPNDRFNDPENAHVIPALINKADSNKDTEVLVIKGTGQPIRQFIYSKDIAQIIIETVIDDVNYGTYLLICAPDESTQYSIKELALFISREFKHIKQVRPEIDPQEHQNNNASDGQKSKTCSNSLMHSLFGYELTPLEVGIKETCSWYKNNITTKNDNKKEKKPFLMNLFKKS